MLPGVSLLGNTLTWTVARTALRRLARLSSSGQHVGQQVGQHWWRSVAAMETTLNVIRALDLEWETLGASPPYRSALARWAEREPALAGPSSPAEVVAGCHSRADRVAANAVVGALLRLAGDPLAARSVLQAILPGLAARGAKGMFMARPSRLCPAAWDGFEELGQELVATAWERIADLAGTSPAWPACVLVEGAWRRVRYRGETYRNQARATCSLDTARAAQADVGCSPGESLAACLLDAVEAGRLRPAQAGVIYTTRVLGHSPASLVPRCGPDAQAVRARRSRAERALVAR